MARIGHRFPLLIYEHTLNRWWPATLMLGLALVGLWWPVSHHPIAQAESWRSQGLLAIGGIVLLMTVFLFLTRKIAYVQPRADHLRLVTPFLRMNISYKRFQKTTASEMHALFPPSKLSGWMRESMAPLMAKTAVVINLNGYPIPRPFLRFFLSRFFFKDKSPHIVILVKEWMSFSAEVESLRSGGNITQPKKNRRNDSILSGLPRA
ncbi:MAG: hypothetical protein B6I38_07630 [Anaerolineaceae bacterium 4572_5.1]|nr:MAG: hypothetical protein B5M51_00700 [Anaerolinea sp. 4484_236]OQY30134.1 MAG: hypothetical protein B6I38_07630 [Anaerolineaceae bacterium 4572_5.1]